MTDAKPSARPAPERRAAYKAFERIQLRWNDNDIYGHLYNATYYELFDCAMTAWLSRNGLIGANGRPTNVVVENGCVFFAEIRYPGEVEVGLRLGRLGSSSVRFEMALFREGEDTAAAQGFFSMVRVDDDDHRPRPIPEAQRAVYATILR
ncbi:acyl-CoA thioesterase [Paracoccus sp. S-4012]|uniref:acyl-CoA thioesterase n=1 Tax=Paracoccus sp. S-4012 TaxID=2665648 RepID=UPI0012B11413|nr:thioesterase family protein [Paracoccus sp. S-4012]MRX51141.1 acyl-CoA thioesterase [Paracoccus sp. S-4012]